jgi:cyclohexanone monooxygenase
LRLARQAKHLCVFQRTANFSLPARNAPLDPAKERAHKAEYPERHRAAFDTPFGIAGHPPPVKSALDATEEERQQAYEAKWAEGGSISFRYAYTDLLLNKKSNETASEFVRRKIRATAIGVILLIGDSSPTYVGRIRPGHAEIRPR